MFGPDQGSTTGLFLWLLCFCLIADIRRLKGPPIQFSFVEGTITIQNTGDTFVDDFYLGKSSMYESIANETLQLSQSKHPHSAVQNLNMMSQHWEKLLFSTGGAINLSKSFWVLMGWNWSKGKATLLPPELSSATLELTEGYNIETLVRVLVLLSFTSHTQNIASG